MDERNYTYKTVGDGQAVDITIWWSGRSTIEAKPIALLFHGGGFVIGSRFMISTQPIRDLTDAGFLVASADYSLCPQVSLFHGPKQDAKDAYRWCKEKLPSLVAREGILVNTSKIVTIGYSAGATLALSLGTEKDPPVAIVDFYGAKLFNHNFWFSPLPMLEQFPLLPEDFLSKIFEEPIRTTTASSLEMTTMAGKPRESTQKGLPAPDLSQPRVAWLFSVLKNGSHICKVVQDNDFDRVDPVRAFSPIFPPTFFIHGMSDTMILPEITVQAEQELRMMGVHTRIALIPGASHGFDLGLASDEEQYQYVKQAIEFLKQHVK